MLSPAAACGGLGASDGRQPRRTAVAAQDRTRTLSCAHRWSTRPPLALPPNPAAATGPRPADEPCGRR